METGAETGEEEPGNDERIRIQRPTFFACKENIFVESLVGLLKTINKLAGFSVIILLLVF